MVDTADARQVYLLEVFNVLQDKLCFVVTFGILHMYEEKAINADSIKSEN